MFDTIREAVMPLLQGDSEKKKEYVEAISRADSEIEKAGELITEAYDKADVKGYHKAQEMQRTARDTKEMYEKKLSDLKANPLLSDSEYNRYCDDITNVIESAKTETIGKLNKIITDLYEVCSSYNKTVKDGNDLLHLLQFEIMRDDCTVVNNSGIKVYISSNEKTLKREAIDLKGYTCQRLNDMEG